jgi:hypothetical protein
MARIGAGVWGLSMPANRVARARASACEGAKEDNPMAAAVYLSSFARTVQRVSNENVSLGMRSGRGAGAINLHERLTQDCRTQPSSHTSSLAFSARG